MNFARQLFTCSLLFAGCAPEDVVFVRFDPDADSAASDAGDDTGVDPNMDAGHVGSESDARVRSPFFDFDAGAARSCGGNGDCRASEYCYLTSCAQKRGTCTARPTNCTANFDEGACGCDGLHYFNNCLRMRNGVNADPSCTLTTSCSSSNPCQDDRAVCSNLWPERSMCRQGPGERACWIVPAQCGPNTLGGDQYIACDAFSSGGPETCVSACQAIQSEAPHMHVSRCPPRSGPSGTNFM